MISAEVDYLADRRDLMQYAAFRRRGIPLGSGAMESAVRRVVNLRCHFQSRRWDELMLRVIQRSPRGVPAPASAKAAA